MKKLNKGSLNLLSDAKIHIHSWFWVAVSSLLIVLQLFWPNRSWTTLLIILSGTWLLAFLWSLSLGRAISLEREIRFGWAQVGDVLQERYTLYNESWLPALYLEVQDHSTIPDYQTGRVTAIEGRNIAGWQTEGICSRRGLYTLGPTSLHSGDPLGLFSVEIHQHDSTSLLVLPPLLPLPAIEIFARGLIGDGRTQRRATLETTINVETVRQYNPGDPLKIIHWPTSAHRDSLFVRQFGHAPSADWWIFLDLEANAQVGSGSSSTLEHGIILTASLSNLGIRQDKKVGLVTHGEHLTWLPPRSSTSQMMEIMLALAVAQEGGSSLTDLLTEARHSIRLGANLIVITANVDGSWIAPLFQLAVKGITPTVLLFDPASYGSKDSMKKVAGILTDHNISHTKILPEWFEVPDAQPGKQGRWEWKVVAPGKVVVAQHPDEIKWRPLV